MLYYYYFFFLGLYFKRHGTMRPGNGISLRKKSQFGDCILLDLRSNNNNNKNNKNNAYQQRHNNIINGYGVSFPPLTSSDHHQHQQLLCSSTSSNSSSSSDSSIISCEGDNIFQHTNINNHLKKSFSEFVLPIVDVLENCKSQYSLIQENLPGQEQQSLEQLLSKNETSSSSSSSSAAAIIMANGDALVIKRDHRILMDEHLIDADRFLKNYDQQPATSNMAFSNDNTINITNNNVTILTLKCDNSSLQIKW